MSIPLRNTQSRFGLVAIVLHWLMALIMIGLVIVGLSMTGLPISAQKLKLYRWHKEFGLLILMLAIVRLTWRLRNITPTLAHLPRWENMAARTVHGLFYFFMFALPLSGWLLTSAAGLPPSFFGFFVLPPLVAPNDAERIVYTVIHHWLAYALIATFFLHVAAALKHLIIDRDKIMQRMLTP